MWGDFEMDVKRWSNFIASGESVVFVGAGLSATSGAPLWSELVGELGRELSPPTAHSDPLLIAQFFRNAFGDYELVKRIRHRLTAPHLKPSRCHEILASMPVRIFVTTNFDTLLEDALRAGGHRVHVVCDDDDLALWDEREEIQVVKLHGDLDRPRSLVISRADYAKRLGGMSALGRKLMDLFWNRSVFFFGYSMRDPDIDVMYQAVATSLGELKRPAFLVTSEDDLHMLREWRYRRMEVCRLPEGSSKSDSLEKVLTSLASCSRDRLSRGDCDVLIVEDDAMVAEVIGLVLAEDLPDLSVLRAREGFEALLVIARQRPSLVLLDLMMPWMTGMELIKRMGEDGELSHIRVIVISAFVDAMESPIVASSKNVVAVLPKPFDMKELSSLVRRVLRSDSANIPGSA